MSSANPLEIVGAAVFRLERSSSLDFTKFTTDSVCYGWGVGGRARPDGTLAV